MVLRALKRRVKSSQKTSWNPRSGESAPWTSTSAQGHQASCHENKDCIFTVCKKRSLILKSTLSSNFGSVCKFYFWLQFLLPKVGSSKTNRANCILPGLQARGSKESRLSSPGASQLGTGGQLWCALGTARPRAASSRHLLVQDEVEVESPVASWSPVLAAAPVSGAHEHECSHAESPQARAQAPRAVHAAAGALASLASVGHQGRAIRGLGSGQVPRFSANARKQLSREVQGFSFGFLRFCAGVLSFRDPGRSALWSCWDRATRPFPGCA